RRTAPRSGGARGVRALLGDGLGRQLRSAASRQRLKTAGDIDAGRQAAEICRLGDHWRSTTTIDPDVPITTRSAAPLVLALSFLLPTAAFGCNLKLAPGVDLQAAIDRLPDD